MDTNKKHVVKCKCGLEFNSTSDRTAHIRKQMSFVSKEVRRSFGFRPSHSNEPGKFIRDIELAVSA